MSKKDMSNVCGMGYQSMEVKRFKGEIAEDEFREWYSNNCAKCCHMCKICMYDSQPDKNINNNAECVDTRWGSNMIDTGVRDALSDMVKRYGRDNCLDYFTTEAQEAILSEYSTAIKYISNPTEEQCMKSVQDNPMNIWYIKNPSYEVQMTAVTLKGESIKYIKDQTEELCIAAVSQSSEAFCYTEIKTPAVCKAAMICAAREFAENYIKTDVKNIIKGFCESSPELNKKG